MKNITVVLLLLVSLFSNAQMKHRIVNDSIVQSEGLGNPDSHTYTYETGWRDEGVTVYDPIIETLGIRYYDNVKDSVYFTVIPKSNLPSLEEAKSIKISEIKRLTNALFLLDNIQAHRTDKQVHDEVISVEVKNKIKGIRQKRNNVISQINALTDSVEVLRFELPIDQIDSLRNELIKIE